MQYFWEIVKRDGSTVEVVPSAVEVVRRRWDAGEPIHFPDMTIPAHQIVDFRRTSKPYGTPLLDAAAQAFKEPKYFDVKTSLGYTEEVLEARWVKKPVTNREYHKTYKHIPGYRRIDDEPGMTVIAFKLPVHEIELQKVNYCTDDEIKVLQRS